MSDGGTLGILRDYVVLREDWGWYVDFGDGGKYGGFMYFCFERMDRFGGWNFEREVTHVD